MTGRSSQLDAVGCDVVASSSWERRAGPNISRGGTQKRVSLGLHPVSLRKSKEMGWNGQDQRGLLPNKTAHTYRAQMRCRLVFALYVCADTLGGSRYPVLPFDPISLVLAQRNGVEPPKKSAFLPWRLHHPRERCCLGCLYSSSPDLGQGLGGYLGNKKRRPVGGVFFIYMAYFFISGLTVSGSAVMVMVNLMPSLSAKLESQSRKSRTCASVPALNILWKLSMKMWEMS